MAAPAASPFGGLPNPFAGFNPFGGGAPQAQAQAQPAAVEEVEEEAGEVFFFLLFFVASGARGARGGGILLRVVCCEWRRRPTTLCSAVFVAPAPYTLRGFIG